MVHAYTEFDRDRWVGEPTKRSGRSEFERDRARVLHSSALRRLAAKTQVVMAGESDFPRTRLTHTLEVAQIAREIGAALGADPDITDLAGLAHDLGHPPFGHNGEDALNQAAEQIGGFEGNAQSFRVLTRLESKVSDYAGYSAGLNLTRAALDSVIKYPWRREAGQRKFNVYDDDWPVFQWVRQEAPAGHKCFEAQIMDWSDDVAYSVHDVEDGVHAGYIDVEAVFGTEERASICKLAHEWYAPEVELTELEAALDRIQRLDYWPRSFDGTWSDMATLKNLTSQLIGRFVTPTVVLTQDRIGNGRPSRHSADLVIPREQRCEVEVLKAMSNLFVFQRQEADSVHSRQQEVLLELVEVLNEQAPAALDPIFLQAWDEAEDDTQRQRVIIDQVASLTDQSVLRWHRRLTR